MKLIVLWVVVALLASAGCTSTRTGEETDWPKVSIEARLLIVDQNFVDEFTPDYGGYPGQVEEYQHTPMKLSSVEVEMVLESIQANERAMSLLAPRMMCADGWSIATTFKSSNVFDRDRPDRYGAELTVRFFPKQVGQSADALQVDFDMQLIPSDVSERDKKRLVQSGRDHVLEAEPWPSFHGSFTTTSGSTWLIPLPNQATRQSVADLQQKEDHLWLIIRPTRIESAAEDERLFPGLPDDGNSIFNQ